MILTGFESSYQYDKQVIFIFLSTYDKVNTIAIKIYKN
jgi:hypothetical protein